MEKRRRQMRADEIELHLASVGVAGEHEIDPQLGRVIEDRGVVAEQKIHAVWCSKALRDAEGTPSVVGLDPHEVDLLTRADDGGALLRRRKFQYSLQSNRPALRPVELALTC